MLDFESISDNAFERSASSCRPDEHRINTEKTSERSPVKKPLFGFLGRRESEAATRHSDRVIECTDIEEMQRAKRARQRGGEMQAGRRADLAFETHVELSQRSLADGTSRIGKNDQAGELRQGFRDQDSGNDRSFGKMTTKEILVAHDIPASFRTNSDLDLEDLGEKQERWLVGKLFDQMVSSQHSRL